LSDISGGKPMRVSPGVWYVAGVVVRRELCVKGGGRTS
jgi:hypothetical protein